MFDGLTSNAIEQISVVEEMITVHEEIIAGKEPQTRRRMKIYAVSACITRLYAIYENFVESIISDFLDALPELLPYTSLPEGFKTDYRIGISHILSRIDSERYGHLVHENVVRWYYEALTSSSTYRFVTEALTHHEHNLRLNVVENLLSRIQLKGFNSWLNHYQSIKTLYTEQSSVYEQVEAEIRNFILLRNDASHGELEDIEGKDNLARFCELIRALIHAISSYLHKCMVEHRSQVGKALGIGKVTEVLPKLEAFVAQVVKTTNLRKGMNIHFVGANYCYSQQILSLQVNDVDVESVVAACDGFEIGLKCRSTPKKGAKIYVDA